MNIQKGNIDFTLDVPYELMETGDETEKPLIIYLHGYKQNIAYFKKKVSNLLTVNGYHLFLQGPYPIYDKNHTRKVEDWGRAWYLYDGRQKQFIESLEKSSVFIQSIIDDISSQIVDGMSLRTSSLKTIMIGYSMGGYLAGYFALSRPTCIDELVVIGARIKTEHFGGNSYQQLHVLALHGDRDDSVSADRQKKSCKELEKMGAKVDYQILDESHRLSAPYIQAVKKWILN